MNKLKPLNSKTKSYNSKINLLSSQGCHHQVINVFSSMLLSNIPTDTHTYPSLIKACTSLNLLSHGLLVHNHVIINGFSSDSHIGSSLIHFYGKTNDVRYARKVFDQIPDRNVVPWTSIIGCYTRNGDVKMGFYMFDEMRRQGVMPSSVTLLSLLCRDLEIERVKCMHCCVVSHGFQHDTALMNSLMNVYSKCVSIDDAGRLFEFIEERDIVSWNILISGYASIGKSCQIVQLMREMKEEGFKLDNQTFGSLVSAIATGSNHEMGKLVHGQIIRSGVNLNINLQTSLMVMYYKCGNIDAAIRIFEQNQDNDVFSWTTMVSGLVQNGCADKALVFFSRMLNSKLQPSTVTIASALAACAQLNSFRLGTSIQGYMLRQGMTPDIPVENSLISLYAKCSHLEQMLTIFYRMSKRDLVSWNALITGCAQNGELDRALSLFNEMRKNHQKPDSFTVVTLLQGCASIGALHQGKWVHNFVTRNYLRPSILVDTALIDMYSKCGDLDSAQKCFDNTLHRDLILWSSIIAGYGCHGEGNIALKLYSDFLHTENKPNHVIFLSVLSACSHNGLVDEGLTIFESMKKDFGIQPRLEHHACIVDLLCRAGRVNEAFMFYKENFPEPSLDVLGILLDGFRTSDNKEFSEMIVREIISLKPSDAGNFVQLARSYASMNKWDGKGEALVRMRSLGLKKLPGWSYIELHGEINIFFMQHSSHPLLETIVSVLKTLNVEVRKMNEQFSCLETIR
ncbi:hypothetical protein ACFE04_026189 [Oxalis oulophora]